MNTLIILGVVLLGIFVFFKMFGKILKIAVLGAVTVAAILYFSGHDIAGLNLPSFNL